MRLLAQPIYRYENTKGDLIDGGLFVFVLGTDPEAFLLIEARRPQSGAPEWRLRRDPDEQHQSADQPPRPRDLERPRNPLVASVGRPRAVLRVPLRARAGGAVRPIRRLNRNSRLSRNRDRRGGAGN